MQKLRVVAETRRLKKNPKKTENSKRCCVSETFTYPLGLVGGAARITIANGNTGRIVIYFM